MRILDVGQEGITNVIVLRCLSCLKTPKVDQFNVLCSLYKSFLYVVLNRTRGNLRSH